MHAFLGWEGPPDWAAKLVEAGGKGPLYFASLIVLVLAWLAWNFFGKDRLWVRIGAFLVMIACIVFFVTVLAIPSNPNKTAQVDLPKVVKPDPAAGQPLPVKKCTGDYTAIFNPDMPGVMQVRPDGSRIDLGDAGGGSRFQEWKYSWTAPADVTNAVWTGGRNEHLLPLGSTTCNKVGNVAECVGEINGGNDAMSVHVFWDGPCK